MIFEELVLAPLPGRCRAQVARGAAGDVSRQGPGFSGQPHHDRQASLSAHSSGVDPGRPDREPDARRAIRRAARNPSGLQEQPALAGLFDQSHARTGRIDWIFARPGGASRRRRKLRRGRSTPISFTTSCGSCWVSGSKCRCVNILTIWKASARPSRRQFATRVRPARWAGTGKLFDPLNLKGLIAGTDPRITVIPPEELTILLDRLKTFAKRVHRSLKLGATRRIIACA